MSFEERRRQLWEILNDFEDHLKTGYRSDHPPLPLLPETDGPAARDTQDPSAEEALRTIVDEVSNCTKCRLCEHRTRAVPGTGTLTPLVIVIGEGPGADEDRSGLPFVGAAGRYLDKWLASIGLSRQTNCYIANIVKCRPPGNRDPLPDERAACLPYLERQLTLLEPRFILTLGRIAAQTLLGTETGIGSLRGSTYAFKGVRLIPTYHPSGVLRNQSLRRDVWDDLKRLKSLIDEG